MTELSRAVKEERRGREPGILDGPADSARNSAPAEGVVGRSVVKGRDRDLPDRSAEGAVSGPRDPEGGACNGVAASWGLGGSWVGSSPSRSAGGREGGGGGAPRVRVITRSLGRGSA